MNNRRTTLMLLCLGAGLSAARAQTSATHPAATTQFPGLTRTPTVEATLRVEDIAKDLKLIGRTEANEIVYLDEGRMRKLALEKVESAYYRIEIDRYVVHQHKRRQNWAGAVNALMKAIKPCLLYLDLPGNNAAEIALDTGDCMMKAAGAATGAAKTDEERAAAEEQYKAAYSLYRYVMEAEWFSGSQVARIRRVQCLLALNKPKTAAHYFNAIDRPFVGDLSYGFYWLVKAQLALVEEDYQGAMDAAVNSVCFENKDVNTFPDALLVTAQCYEELQNWHRARDVYYEVARVFPNTEWSGAARKRLRFIMKEGHTTEKEDKLIEHVFFGLDEDMNEMAKELLQSEPVDPFAVEEKSVSARKRAVLDVEIDLDEDE